MITTGFTYVAVLLFLAGALVSLEKTSNPILGKLFCYLPAIALCYLLPMVLCSYGAWDLEATQPVYDALASSLTYALVFTMLLRCDLRRIIKLGPTILITFFSASVTICIGFVAAFILMQPYIGSDAWKTLGALCGSWMGGSGNMIAIQTALNISEVDMGYALIIDSVNYTVWVIFLLSVVPMAEKFNHWTKANPRFLDKAAKRLTSGSTAPTRAISSHSLLFLVGTSLLASAVCQKLGAIFHTMVPLIDTSTWTILLISAAALLCASSPIGQVAGSTELSSVFLYCVITLMASRVNLSQLMNVPYWIVTGFLVLIIHAVLMVLICKLLRLDLFTAGTASLANIGGTASAPVLASSYDGTLIPVATMMALMGYAIGTPGGILTANIMKLFR